MATRDSSIVRPGGAGRLETELLEANQRLVVAAIREQESAERAAQQAAEMAALMEHLQAGVVVLDDSMAIRLINEAARNILGVAPPPGTNLAAINLTFQTLRGGTIQSADSPFGRMMAGGGFDTRSEIVICRPDGQRRTVVIGCSPIFDKLGRLVSGIAVIHDVTEVRELERMREEYVSLISHDLRSPLSAISMAAELLEHLLAVKGLTVEANNAARIGQSTARIQAMIEDLTESTGLEAGQFQLRRKAVDLSELLPQLCARISPPEAGRLIVELADRPPRIEVDANRIERALVNIVTNALKYSPADAPVKVRCETVDGEVIISVADRGPGLESRDADRIFQKYFRSSAQPRSEGAGLGLYITRLIAEAHGGRVWVESEVGRGSTFYFSIPIAG
jgi:NtrC-family two-component system sensor histidine kinase KinB